MFISLAFSDLAAGLLLQLMRAIIYAVVWKMASREDNLASLCPTVLSVYSYFGYLLIAASFLNVTVIAGDRLLAVSLHLWYHELVTPKRVTTVVSVWIISCVLKILFIFFPNEIQMVAAVICLTGYVITPMTYVRIYKVVKYHQNQIHGQNQLQNSQTRKVHRQRKSAYNSLFVSVVFFACYFPFFSLYNTIQDKHLWNFISYSSNCVVFLNLPEFIIKPYCLLPAVPRDSPNCETHSEENNLHEREYDIRKDLKLRIVLTKNVMRSFMKRN